MEAGLVGKRGRSRCGEKGAKWAPVWAVQIKALGLISCT